MHQYADLLDIFTAFKRIDELKLKTHSFVARNLNRLPRHGPEDINVFLHVDRISTIECERAVVRTNVDHIKTKPVVFQPPTYASTAATNVPVNSSDRGQAIRIATTNVSVDTSDRGQAIHTAATSVPVNNSDSGQAIY